LNWSSLPPPLLLRRERKEEEEGEDVGHDRGKKR